MSAVIKYVRPSKRRGDAYRWHLCRIAFHASREDYRSYKRMYAESKQGVLLDSIIEWVDSNCGQENFNFTAAFLPGHVVQLNMKFRHKTDAILFKLTWA